MTNRPGTALSLPMPPKALEFRFIEADIREELLGMYLCALSIYPDESSWKNRLHFSLLALADSIGSLSSTLPALIPRKEMIQNSLQAPFPTEKLAVCNISRRWKGGGAADTVLLLSIKEPFKFGGITGENHNLFSSGAADYLPVL